jgi:inorganic pyrophosphatase
MSTPPRLHQLATFDDSGCVRVVVETTAGTRSKLKYQPSLDTFEVHLVVPAGLVFPRDFGFVPSTLGEDGDPLDALVFADEPTPTGVIVPCRLVGVLQALQSRPGEPAKRNDRFLAVSSHGHQYAHWRDLPDVPDATLAQLEAFFIEYDRRRGVEFRPVGRGDAARARQLLEQGCSRCKSSGG